MTVVCCRRSEHLQEITNGILESSFIEGVNEMTASGSTKHEENPHEEISLYLVEMSVQKLLEKIKSCFVAVSASQTVISLKRQTVENNQAYENIIGGQKGHIVEGSLQIIYEGS